MDLLAWEDADSESLEGLLGTSGYGDVLLVAML